MSYFTLDDLKSLARNDGWAVDDQPYSYADDTVLKAYILFKYQIQEDFEKIKMACLTGSKSALDPDIKFILRAFPRVGSYLPIICKIHPGLMLGKTEACTFASSIPLYLGTTSTPVPESFDITYSHDCYVAVSCFIEDDSTVTIKVTSDHLNEELNIANILPYREHSGSSGGNTPEPGEENSVIGICKLGTAIML